MPAKKPPRYVGIVRDLNTGNEMNIRTSTIPKLRRDLNAFLDMLQFVDAPPALQSGGSNAK